ncbi:MAG TPA: hypothetical protein ACFCUD_02310 [Cyclobacteriaceae bacterium]
MNNDELAYHSQELIQKHMLLNENELQIQKQDVDDPLKELEFELTRLVQNLLDTDFNRLINAMYRIDINQQVFQKIVNETYPDHISNELAKVIINREIEKVKTREKYKKH